jgi:hypothetical protein
MKAILAGFLLILSSVSAEDTWSKVKALKSGTEIRVFQAGAKEPLVGKIDEADDERIVLALKNEQKAVAKADIERLEARPTGGRPVTKTSTVKREDPSAELAKPKVPVPGSSATPALSSSSSSVSFGSKPGFELVYRKGMK